MKHDDSGQFFSRLAILGLNHIQHRLRIFVVGNIPLHHVFRGGTGNRCNKGRLRRRIGLRRIRPKSIRRNSQHHRRTQEQRHTHWITPAKIQYLNAPAATLMHRRPQLPMTNYQLPLTPRSAPRPARRESLSPIAAPSGRPLRTIRSRCRCSFAQ